MEKKILRVNVATEEFNAEWDTKDHTPITDLIGWLQSVQSKGATHIDWNARAYDGDSSEVEATAFYKREESDKEFGARMKQMKDQEEAEARKRVEIEKRMYEELKQKYGSDTSV